MITLRFRLESAMWRVVWQALILADEARPWVLPCALTLMFGFIVGFTVSAVRP